MLAPGARGGKSAVSAEIIQLFRDASFDAVATRAMGDAYDRARKTLHDRGQPPLVQEIIARRIIEIARTGQRDPERLCALTLKSFGFDHSE
jgi:hypothetical protein